MYAIKAGLRKSRTEGKPGYIVFRLRDHDGAERMFATGVQSTDEEFTTVNKDYIIRGLRLLYSVIKKFYDSGKPYNIDDIADEFRKHLSDVVDYVGPSDFKVNRKIASVGKPFNKMIEDDNPDKDKYQDGSPLSIQNIPGFITKLLLSKDVSKRSGTVSNYKSIRSTLSEFIKTLPKDRTAIDESFVADFYEWLKTLGITTSTVSFYLRMFRSVLNKAMKMGVFQMSYNWFSGMIERYEPDEERNMENSLSKQEIREIANLVIEDDPLMDLSRDLFMFSFYCRGMELFDILNLTPENINGDVIVYNKRLTGKRQVMKIDPQAKRIIDKYRDESEGYIFSAITRYSTSREYNTLRRLIWPKLAELGKLLGIKTPMVFSTARNTWTELTRAPNLSSMLLS